MRLPSYRTICQALSRSLDTRVSNLPVTIILVLLPTLLFVACQVATPTTSVNAATFTALDYAFVGPVSLPAGLTQLRIDNDSQEAVQIRLLKLSHGQTVAGFVATAQADTERLPAWAPVWFGHAVAFLDPGQPLVLPSGELIGSVTRIALGEAGFLTVSLEPGNYAVVCLLADADRGQSPEIVGMMRELKVG